MGVGRNDLRSHSFLLWGCVSLVLKALPRASIVWLGAGGSYSRWISAWTASVCPTLMLHLDRNLKNGTFWSQNLPLWQLRCKNHTHVLGYVIKMTNFPSRWIEWLGLSSMLWSSDDIMGGLDLSQHGQWRTVDGREVGPLPVSLYLKRAAVDGSTFELILKEKLGSW